MSATASIGVTLLSHDDSPSSATRRADELMYESKRSGGDRTTAGRPFGNDAIMLSPGVGTISVSAIRRGQPRPPESPAIASDVIQVPGAGCLGRCRPLPTVAQTRSGSLHTTGFLAWRWPCKPSGSPTGPQNPLPGPSSVKAKRRDRWRGPPFAKLIPRSRFAKVVVMPERVMSECSPNRYMTRYANSRLPLSRGLDESWPP